METELVATASAGALVGAGVFAFARALAIGGPLQPLRRMVSSVPAGRGVAVRLGCAATAGLCAGAVTGWPVAGLLGAAALWWLPEVLGPDRAMADEAGRVEAVAAWTEQLRDMISGASGLQSAIAATADIAPAAIRDDVAHLAWQLRSGLDVHQAMAVFAQRVDNPTADLVAVALSTADGRHAADLSALLSRLAESSRDRATMLVRTSAGRARVRSSVRIIIAMTALMLVGMVGLNRGYLTPFDTLAGQFVLAGVGAIWAAAVVWLMRLARPVQGARFLRPSAGGPA
ncbi:type II secretion system F family protein [Nocardiopsis trehalosi]|uniref:type II secretion system F family protein n=1 Tax=Nocardiopsis trehalosi TaxID=109329 RepID=UPI00082997A8|nr:type II secretion system F family protein [Nocardiopsis trehalosi]